MKQALLISAILISLAGGPARAASPLSVAIFDFESKDEATRDLGPKVAVILNARLSTSPDLMLVERAEIEKVLGEQELGVSGTVSSDTAAKIGHITGAKVLVTGKVFKLDRELMIVTKVIGTETSRVYGDLVKGPASSALDDLVAKLAEQITSNVVARADTLVAKVLTREERIAALQKQLGEARRPSLAIRLPERHVGPPLIDPAAETELGLILSQCGFHVIDEKSQEKPEVEITGEAFSAFGIRRGNLVSCKARVELKAHVRKDGRLLAVDRQTSVAMDIAEATAAKSALENAAADLADRLASRLILGAKVARGDSN